MAPPTFNRRKSPLLAVIASGYLPGLGSIINGDVALGCIIFVGYLIGGIFTAAISLYIVVVPIGFFVWGLVDAYLSAKRWNVRHGLS